LLFQTLQCQQPLHLGPTRAPQTSPVLRTHGNNIHSPAIFLTREIHTISHPYLVPHIQVIVAGSSWSTLLPEENAERIAASRTASFSREMHKAPRDAEEEPFVQNDCSPLPRRAAPPPNTSAGGLKAWVKNSYYDSIPPLVEGAEGGCGPLVKRARML